MHNSSRWAKPNKCTFLLVEEPLFDSDPCLEDVEEFLLDPDDIAEDDLECEIVGAKALASSDTLVVPLDSVAVELLVLE